MASWDSPWDSDDGRPLVLVSFSTTRLWDPASANKQHLGGAGRRGQFGCCSLPEAISLPPQLTRQRNRAAVRCPHAQVLPFVSVTVTHCGHGTVTASLAHGVADSGSLLPRSRPALPRGPASKRWVREWPWNGESSPAVIKSAVRDLLDRPSFREARGSFGRGYYVSLREPAGAADVLEELARHQEH